MGRYDAINPKEPKKESLIKKFINEAVLLKKLDRPIKIVPQPTPGNNPDRPDALVQTYPYYGGYQGVVGLTGAQGITGAEWTGGYTGVQGLTGFQTQDDIQIRVYENGDLTREAIVRSQEAIVRARQARYISQGVPRIIQADDVEEPVRQGPRSQLLTIMGPSGSRIMIPIRSLNYQTQPTAYTNEVELIIRMSAAESQSLINDIETARREYGITSVSGGSRRRMVT